MILNGATGAIGGCVIQLCAMLKLRAIAVVRRHETGPASDPVKVEKRLKALGAAEVLVEDDAKMGASGLKLELEKQKFFAKPKLALDCVGGVSASRLAETLQDGCELVCFGCVTGKAVTVPWTGAFILVCVRAIRMTWLFVCRSRRPRPRRPGVLPPQVDGGEQEEGETNARVPTGKTLTDRPSPSFAQTVPPSAGAQDARNARQARQRGQDPDRLHRVRALVRVHRGDGARAGARKGDQGAAQGQRRREHVHVSDAPHSLEAVKNAVKNLAFFA